MNIGIDIVSVSRIKNAVEKNSKFVKRVFTEKEEACIFQNKIRWDRAAGFFAAKEAFSKYLGSGIGKNAFKDIEVRHTESGEPKIFLRGKRTNARISISHTDEMAVAVVCGVGEMLIDDKVAKLLPKRKSDAHKALCGRIFILAGSEGMTGAVCLCANGALKSGAGLVTVGTAKSERPIVACKLTEAMTVGFCEKDGGIGLCDIEKIKDIADRADVFVLGPGIGRGAETKELVLKLTESVKIKTVLDADGLNAVSENIDILNCKKAEMVLTPHEGEMALLCGKSSEFIKNNRETVALSFAKKYGIVLVLKGKNTIVTDGEKLFVNPTGNAGMATGGSGDVLSGIIGSFAGQGLSLYDASVLGVYVHGLAGDLAKKHKGEIGMTALDIAENLPYAIKILSGE